LGCALGLDYKLKESLDCFKKSLDLSIKSNNLMGMAHLKSAMAMNYSLQGKSDLALKIIKEAVQEATESGDILAKQPVYTNYGVTCYYKGCLDEAEKNLKEALAYHEKTFQASWGAVAHGWLGWTYHDAGNFDMARQHHQQCISILEDARLSPSWLNCNKLWMMNHRILSGEPDIDMHKLAELIKSHEKSRYALFESYGIRCIGEIYLNIDDQHMAEAEKWIKRAIDFDTMHGIPWNLGKDYALYADWYKKKGDMAAAKEQLARAIDLFKECGADGWVTITEEKLARLM
jgi:hypothetical protein